MLIIVGVYCRQAPNSPAWNASNARRDGPGAGHLFRHCKKWKNEQRELWKVVGQETGWKAGRCRHVQILELFSLEMCDQAVMDLLAATEVGKFPRHRAEQSICGSLSFRFVSFRFILAQVRSVVCHCFICRRGKGRRREAKKGRRRGAPPPSRLSGGRGEFGTAIL